MARRDAASSAAAISVAEVAEQEQKVIVVGLANMLEDFLGFGLGSRLHETQELTELVALGLEDLIAPAQRRPAAFAFFGFVLAFGSQILAAGTDGPGTVAP